MKTAIAVTLMLCAGSVMAQSHYRQGYIRKDGTYVAPTMQTNPNDTKLDNYSTKGNVNPYNGKPGTVDPYKPEQPAQSGAYQNQGWYNKR